MVKKEYLIKKLIVAIVTLFLVITVNFLLFRVLPGDPVSIMYRDPRVRSPELLERVRERMGLDKPMGMQFILYIRETLRGNLGVSFTYHKPVMEVILARIPNTVILVGVASILAAVVGVFLGAVSGWKRGSKTDFSIFSFSLVVTWTPSFWLATMLLVIFGYRFSIFPVGGISTPATGWTGFKYYMDVLRHMVLPIICLFFWYLGEYVLLMRGGMLDVLTEDYIVTARAKGLREFVIIKDHAVRNALLPVVTMMAINLGFVVAGSIQIETVFSYPGVGGLVFESLFRRDYPLLQGTFFILSISVIIANFLADVIYAYLDPRVTMES